MNIDNTAGTGTQPPADPNGAALCRSPQVVFDAAGAALCRSPQVVFDAAGQLRALGRPATPRPFSAGEKHELIARAHFLEYVAPLPVRRGALAAYIPLRSVGAGLAALSPLVSITPGVHTISMPSFGVSAVENSEAPPSVGAAWAPPGIGAESCPPTSSPPVAALSAHLASELSSPAPGDWAPMPFWFSTDRAPAHTYDFASAAEGWQDRANGTPYPPGAPNTFRLEGAAPANEAELWASGATPGQKRPHPPGEDRAGARRRQ